MAGIDLVDWTIENARRLEAERLEKRPPEDDPLATSVLPLDQSNTGGEAESRKHQASIENPEPQPSTQPFVEPMPAAATQLPPSIQQFCPYAALRKAITNPDKNTDKSDRDRAVDLRWMLRDIRSKRTNWWPVSQHDLQILIEMELVEMRGDVPVLTKLGLDAIA